MADAFEVTSGPHAGARAMHPGDFGVAALDINCRCTTVAVIEDKAGNAIAIKGNTLVAKGGAWDRFDAGIAPWERKAERLYRKRFRAQRDAVLEAIGAQ